MKVEVKGNDDFVKKYNAIRTWLADNNCDEELKKLEMDKSFKVTIIEGEINTINVKKSNHGKIIGAKIIVDLDSFTRRDNGFQLSPAVSLMHEVDHAVVAMTDNNLFDQLKSEIVSYFDNALEMQAILNTETNTARALGEIGPEDVSRPKHVGYPGPSVDGLTPEQQSVLAYRYNMYLKNKLVVHAFPKADILR